MRKINKRINMVIGIFCLVLLELFNAPVMADEKAKLLNYYLTKCGDSYFIATKIKSEGNIFKEEYYEFKKPYLWKHPIGNSEADKLNGVTPRYPLLSSVVRIYEKNKWSAWENGLLTIYGVIQVTDGAPWAKIYLPAKIGLPVYVFRYEAESRKPSCDEIPKDVPTV